MCSGAVILLLVDRGAKFFFLESDHVDCIIVGYDGVT